MVFRWRDEQTLRFIEAYKKYRCLWDSKCKEYNKTHIRERAYQDLVDELNFPDLTVPDIKAKIKTVRTRYSSELNKIRNSEHGGAGIKELYVPRLFWFNHVDCFLRPFIKSSSNVEDSNGTSRKPNQDEESVQIVKNELHDDDENSENSMSEQHSTEYVPAFTENYPKPTTTTRRKRVYSNDSTDGSSGKLQKLPDENNSSQQVHEFDVFCNSLAIQLKKMPLERSLLCQEKLQAVMTKERLSLLSFEH